MSRCFIGATVPEDIYFDLSNWEIFNYILSSSTRIHFLSFGMDRARSTWAR
jgi:hypothetical protein